MTKAMREMKKLKFSYLNDLDESNRVAFDKWEHDFKCIMKGEVAFMNNMKMSMV